MWPEFRVPALQLRVLCLGFSRGVVFTPGPWFPVPSDAPLARLQFLLRKSPVRHVNRPHRSRLVGGSDGAFEIQGTHESS